MAKVVLARTLPVYLGVQRHHLQRQVQNTQRQRQHQQPQHHKLLDQRGRHRGNGQRQCQPQIGSHHARQPDVQQGAPAKTRQQGRVKPAPQQQAGQYRHRRIHHAAQQALYAGKLVTRQGIEQVAGQAARPATQQATEQQQVGAQVQLDRAFHRAGNKPGNHINGQAHDQAQVSLAVGNGVPAAACQYQHGTQHANGSGSLQRKQGQAAKRRLE